MKRQSLSEILRLNFGGVALNMATEIVHCLHHKAPSCLRHQPALGGLSASGPALGKTVKGKIMIFGTSQQSWKLSDLQRASPLGKGLGHRIGKSTKYRVLPQKEGSLMEAC